MAEERRSKHRSTPDDVATVAKLAVALDDSKDTRGKMRRKERKEKESKDKDKDKDRHSHSSHRRESLPSHGPSPAAPVTTTSASRGHLPVTNPMPRSLLPSSASAPIASGMRTVPRTMAPARATADELLEYLLAVPPAEAGVAVSEFACAYRYFFAARELLLQLITRFKNAPAVGRYAPEEVQRDWKAPSGEAVRGRVLLLVECWVREHFYDFEDDDVLFRSLLAFLDSSHASVPMLVARVRQAIQEHSEEPILRLFGTALTPALIDAALRKESVGVSLLVHRSIAGAPALMASELVEWLCTHSAITSRGEAATLCTALLRDGFLQVANATAPTAAGAAHARTRVDFSADSSVLYVLHPTPVHALAASGATSLVALDSFQAMDVTDVARQLTLVAHELYRRVRPADLKPSLAPTALSVSDGGHGSAVQTLQALHERTACWVATEIVLSKAADERAAMLARFVSLAEALHGLHNYHGLFAVMAGLALKPVERLRTSWRALTADVAGAHEQLSELVSPTSAFAAYRADLSTCGAARALPHLALILSDVRALESSASDFADELHRDVNYKKLRTFAGVFGTQVRPYQGGVFPFAPVLAVQEYLARAVVIAHPADLYKISLQCEPLA